METVYKAYKYRIYPTESQKELLAKHFGAVRFVYNLALETKIEAYKKGVNLSCYDLQRQIKDLKIDCVWLNEVSRYALDKSIANLDNAYKKFFKGAGFPNYKKKSNLQSYSVRQYVKLTDSLYIPKFQEGIKIVQHRKMHGEIRSVTITKTPTNKYFASIMVKEDKPAHNKIDKIVGIDLGIKTFATLSDGVQYSSPNYLRKSLSRLAVMQRRAFRKKRGSINRKKANLKVALLHEKITNQRANFLHNVSNEITNHNGIICIENLAVANMSKNQNLSLSISDAGWGDFAAMLRYKSEWKGRQLITIGRFDASTKICSKCGNKKEMPLGDRVYNCSCGLSIDRDLNAAINIRNLGVLRTVEPVELPELSGTVKQELVGKPITMDQNQSQFKDKS